MKTDKQPNPKSTRVHKPAVRRPVGMQQMGIAIYQQIRSAVRELKLGASR
jgi:hypothetical protein